MTCKYFILPSFPLPENVQEARRRQAGSKGSDRGCTTDRDSTTVVMQWRAEKDVDDAPSLLSSKEMMTARCTAAEEWGEGEEYMPGLPLIVCSFFLLCS